MPPAFYSQRKHLANVSPACSVSRVFRNVDVLRELCGCALLAATIAAAACTSLTGSRVASTTVNTYSPVTGIEVDASQLFEGDGCGIGPSLPYKYVVVVYTAYGSGPLVGQPVVDPTSADGGLADPIAISLNDCFADAVFENLNASSTIGGSDTFSLAIDVFDSVTFGAQPLDTTTTTQANAAAIASVAKWTTTCVARQQPNVQSLSTCGPLIATGN
jgi:hypothetical protein